jgi:hypothetical protein
VLSRPIGVPAMVNGTPPLAKLNTIAGPTSPKACRQPSVPRAVMFMPLLTPTTVAPRRPSVVKVVASDCSRAVNAAALPLSRKPLLLRFT